jgi:hypothetical protein
MSNDLKNEDPMFEGGDEEGQEFDDWYNDGEACGADLQNQAASLADATTEERVIREAGDEEGQIGSAPTRLGGQLLLKFQNSEGNEGTDKASAHIAWAGSDFWVALTARHSL